MRNLHVAPFCKNVFDNGKGKMEGGEKINEI